MTVLFHLLVYLVTGSIAGYLAGLFGVGGGIIIVPVLVILFKATGISPAVIMPLAIGTSMAVVSVTSLLGAHAHYSNANVDWTTAKLLLPVVLFGVVIGALLGSYIARDVLVWCVIAFELSVATMFVIQVLHREGHGEGAVPKKALPHTAMLAISGTLGLVSSVVGIAGGTLFVPFLGFCGVGMRKAIGTATTLGAPLSLVAACVYLLTGLLGNKQLPSYSMGFIYLPAFLGCVAGGIWTARHGASLGLKLNLRWLKLAFALILFGAAGKMLFL